MISYALQDTTIDHNKLIWYADDLILVAPEQELPSLYSQIEHALDTIGLHFSPSKTVKLSDNHISTWLGYPLKDLIQ